MYRYIALLAGPALLLGSVALHAQQTGPAAAAPASPPSAATNASALSSSLGVYVFPSKNQSAQRQSNDEAACFGWAKSQTGIDPLAIAPQTAPASQQTASPANAGAGAPVRGAVGGAVAGTAIGAIAGNAGKGAAIGATTGVLAGVAAKNRAQQQAAVQQQQQQDAAAQQAQASIAQQRATYNKAFSACMEGKGYAAK